MSTDDRRLFVRARVGEARFLKRQDVFAALTMSS
jgi:hypothetical protein